MNNRNDTISIVANDSYIKMSNKNDTLNVVNTNRSISLAIKILGEFSEYYIPIFVCLSLLINSLSVYVFFCTKLRYSSSSIYLGALAISDIGFLIIILFEDWFELKYLIDVEWLTILLLGSEKLFDFLSLWIIVVFIVQRYITMKWPLLRHLDTVNRAKTVVIGLAVLAVLICIPKFIILYMYAMYIKNNEEMMKDSMNSTNDEEQYKSTDDEEQYENLLYYWWWICKMFDAIITFVLPTTTIAILNVLIVHNIRKHNRIRRNLILSSAASNKETQSSNNETSHIKITKMLVIISSIIIFLNTPFQICQLCVLEEIEMSGKLLYIISIITLSLWLTNYGINFFLHCATGKNFRSELIRIFTKRSDTRRDEDIYID